MSTILRRSLVLGFRFRVVEVEFTLVQACKAPGPVFESFRQSGKTVDALLRDEGTQSVI
jgi:hypothetical protein